MNYHMLKTDAFSNTFSMVETGRNISFEYRTAINAEQLNKIHEGDKILGYSVIDNMVKTVFSVNSISADNKLSLYKDIDVRNGIPIDAQLIGKINANGIISLSEEEYTELYKRLVAQFWGDNNKIPKLENCLKIKRNPRSSKKYPLNFIIYGAPGTGKTYSTAEYALAIINNSDVNLSPKSDSERKAIMSEYKDYMNMGRIVFTTFHQNYGYEEFIQGLRPDAESEKLAFKTVDGVFKQIADSALNDPDNDYVIIIDEINRANISKVLGELITLIEEDKRWGEVNETCVTLQSGDLFAVPNNLYIIGTMNSADKSISLIDAAIRRRFEFLEQKPDSELIDNDKVRELFKKLNEKLVSELDSSDLLVGHSYFMKKSEEEIPQIMNNSIIPLLYEYFYDNKKKVLSVVDNVIGEFDVEVVNNNFGRLSVKKRNEEL